MFNIWQPFCIDLQLFNEGEGEGQESVTSEEVAEPQNDVLENDTETDVDMSDEDTGESDSDTIEDVETAKPQPKQSDEENAKFAAARREAEAQAKALKQKQDNFAKKYGYSSFEEMETAQAQAEAEEERQRYLQAGVDPDIVNKLVDEKLQNHPAMQKAREAEAKVRIDENLNGLWADFPELKETIKTIQDAEQKLPNIDKVTQYVSMGHTLSDAYFLANKKEIISKRAEAAKHAAINNVQSKGHMKATGQGIDISNVKVPPETYKMYKQFNPKMTDEQIKKHYAQSL